MCVYVLDFQGYVTLLLHLPSPVVLQQIWNIFKLFKYFLNLGEKLEREEVDILVKECCDPEDDDGFIPYERKFLSLNFVRIKIFYFNFSFLEKSLCWSPSWDVWRLVNYQTFQISRISPKSPKLLPSMFISCSTNQKPSSSETGN